MRGRPSRMPLTVKDNREQCEMVRLEEKDWNTFFEALEEWERHLAFLDRDDLRCGDEHFRQ